MKLIFFSLLVVLIFSCASSPPVKLQDENLGYSVRRSEMNDFKNLLEFDRKWREINKDTVIYTTYFKGAHCDIPNEKEMSIKISNDTLYFNFGLAKISPDCERKIGVAGIMIDFVLYKNKYPNYKKLKIKYITR